MLAKNTGFCSFPWLFSWLLSFQNVLNIFIGKMGNCFVLNIVCMHWVYTGVVGSELVSPEFLFESEGDIYLPFQDDASLDHICFLGCDLKSSPWNIWDTQGPGELLLTATGSMRLGRSPCRIYRRPCWSGGRGPFQQRRPFFWSEISSKEIVSWLGQKSPGFPSVLQRRRQMSRIGGNGEEGGE